MRIKWAKVSPIYSKAYNVSQERARKNKKGRASQLDMHASKGYVRGSEIK